MAWPTTPTPCFSASISALCDMALAIVPSPGNRRGLQRLANMFKDTFEKEGNLCQGIVAVLFWVLFLFFFFLPFFFSRVFVSFFGSKCLKLCVSNASFPHSANSEPFNFWGIIYHTWNLTQPVFSGGFSWMIPNVYMKNVFFTKHPLKTGCLEFQVYIFSTGKRWNKSFYEPF